MNVIPSPVPQVQIQSQQIYWYNVFQVYQVFALEPLHKIFPKVNNGVYFVIWMPWDAPWANVTLYPENEAFQWTRMFYKRDILKVIDPMLSYITFTLLNFLLTSLTTVSGHPGDDTIFLLWEGISQSLLLYFENQPRGASLLVEQETISRSERLFVVFYFYYPGGRSKSRMFLLK